MLMRKQAKVILVIPEHFSPYTGVFWNVEVHTSSLELPYIPVHVADLSVDCGR